jgi:hypothetical protein
LFYFNFNHKKSLLSNKVLFVLDEEEFSECFCGEKGCFRQFVDTGCTNDASVLMNLDLFILKNKNITCNSTRTHTHAL